MVSKDTIDLALSIDSLSEKPVSGKYTYDAAFAEWEGKSMGVKVTVLIDGDSVKVVYEGEGSLSVEIGEVLDLGVIAKHQSGYWIITQKPQDVFAEEIGGCTGGPTILDFKNKRYWLC